MAVIRMTGKTRADLDAEAAEVARTERNEAARAYLRETDWYIIRNIETGAAVPSEVIERRTAERAKVVHGVAEKA